MPGQSSLLVCSIVLPHSFTYYYIATALTAQVETLARTVLQAPVEIQVGGRSIVNADITQLVELREEDDRFLRLLEVLPASCLV